jgi:Ca2+-binding RTX toxin-like protein
MPTGVENLEMIGTNPSGGYGNELDNVMIGNSAYNALDGRAGHDALYGGGSGDNLFGGAGNDILDGGTGGDFMQGGLGDDVYYVDTYQDLIIEPENFGIDTIRTRTSMVLPDNIENLELDPNLTNAYAHGNGLNNVIRGNGTQNEIIGGGGMDTMFGGGGADTFRFFSVGEAAPLGGAFTDYIPDFNEAEGDRNDLRAIDANLLVAGDQAFVPIGVNVPFTGAGQLRFNGGYLEGDVNGDRVADFQIHLDVASLSGAGLLF